MQATMVFHLGACPKCKGDLTNGEADDEKRCIQCGKIVYAYLPEGTLTSDYKKDIWQADQAFLNFHRPMLMLFQAGHSAKDVALFTSKNQDWVRHVLNRFNQIKEYRDVGF